MSNSLIRTFYVVVQCCAVLRRDLHLHVGFNPPELHVSPASRRHGKWCSAEHSLPCARLWTPSRRLCLVCNNSKGPVGLLHRVPDGRYSVRVGGLPHLLYPLVIPFPPFFLVSNICVRTTMHTVQTSALPILASRCSFFVSSFRNCARVILGRRVLSSCLSACITRLDYHPWAHDGANKEESSLITSGHQ